MKATNTPSAEGEGFRFFRRLSEWESTPRLLEVFEQVFTRDISELRPNFDRRLYEYLIDQLLEWLEMPRTNSAMEWEWRELYHLGRETDPYYFSEGKIRKLLSQWPIIEFHQQHVLTSVLAGFFQLRRNGFPSRYPSPLLPNQECAQWTRIFPPEWAWESLNILHRVGISSMGSMDGYRVFSRVMLGKFTPDLDPNTLRRWQAECWQAARLFDTSSDDHNSAHRANFVASTFGGRNNILGFEGFCGTIPECAECSLISDCSWFNTPAENRTESPEIITMARQGQVENLSLEQLFQGLFDLSAEDGETLTNRISGTTLRQLAAKSYPELVELVGAGTLLPERLRIAFELGMRYSEERMSVGGVFRTPWDIFKHFRMRLRDLKQEQFIVVLLDNKKQYLDDQVITQGTLNASPVHPREVFNAAIRKSAAFVVLVHNHPSGDPNPSKEDIQVTEQLMQVGQVVGIPVLDHIIIADDQYTSLLDKGLMNLP